MNLPQIKLQCEAAFLLCAKAPCLVATLARCCAAEPPFFTALTPTLVNPWVGSNRRKTATDLDIGDKIMAKLNEKTHNADGSTNVASDEMIINTDVQRRIGLEACEALTMCFAGGDEYQGRNIATQLCRMVDFMLPYQQDQLSTFEADKVVLEENENKATFDEEMEDLKRKIDEKTTNVNQLLMLRDITRKNFHTSQGFKYVPKETGGRKPTGVAATAAFLAKRK
jgi:hypothetical protein